MELSGLRAVVVDEAALLRRGVAVALEGCGVGVVAETHSGRDATRLAESERAGLIVVGATVDLVLPDVVRRARRLRPAPAVVALLGRSADAAGLLAMGVEAMLLRTAREDDLVDAVLRVMKGERVVAPALLPSLVGEVSPRPGVADDAVLTVREREILAFIAEGRANREIAAELFVTLATVKTHVAHIYAKLGARNRNEALGRAVALGLLG